MKAPMGLGWKRLFVCRHADKPRGPPRFAAVKHWPGAFKFLTDFLSGIFCLSIDKNPSFEVTYAMQKSKRSHGPNPVADKKIRVLVIDDNEVDLKLASATVEKAGYETFEAIDGKSGLAMARACAVDIILLDYNLTDSKGPEICKILKSDTATQRIPVLFLTGMESPSSIIECYAQGGENYLAKPINPKLLLKQIAQALQDKRV